MTVCKPGIKIKLREIILLQMHSIYGNDFIYTCTFQSFVVIGQWRLGEIVTEMIGRGRV